MVHSSELMPGGSPYFKNDKEIENLYEDMELLFSKIVLMGYKGLTLKEYFETK